MPSLFERLDSIRAAANLADIANITRGLEKESLRASLNGKLASTPHPKALGSALTHPRITTDYSEALLEFITPPSSSVKGLTQTLDDLHRYTYQHIGDESLWVNSMPCMIGSDTEIPIAQYGSSNSGRMKSIYRLGLGYRYGRAMQTIAGTHFNFSVSDDFWQFLRTQDKSNLSLMDYKTEGYFRLIRNFRRYFWILLYLFGAAPAVCKTFISERDHKLVPVGKDTHSLHTPYATSLRMGDLGYQSSAQESLIITYNCLDSYTQTLCQAITQTHPDYAAIGVLDQEGQHKQLNDCLLQIENEFYSVIRPKRTTQSGQTALNALSTGGVEYIEVRCLDLNPYDPVGINQQQIQFLDTFLLFCLLEDSPPSDEKEYLQLQENQHRMVYNGRDPLLTLFHNGKERGARDWGKEIIEKLKPIAELLDLNTCDTDRSYQQALTNELMKFNNDSLTPSAKIIESLHEQQVTFYRLAMNASLKNREHFLEHTLDQGKVDYYTKMAKESLEQQSRIEADTSINFNQFLQNYYDQYECRECEQKPIEESAKAATS
ncbi:MAG: glutamate--cysteine ligase [Cellvibrionaceae bacterium]